MNKHFQWLLDIIFPKYCLGCSREGSYICPDCFHLLPVLPSTTCFVCKKRSPTGRLCPACKKKSQSPLNGLFVASSWESELLRQMIYGYKYNFVKELAEPLSRIIINFLETIDFVSIEDEDVKLNDLILVPVPLHKRRALWRGFNQAELLCRNIGKNFDLETKTILKRTRNTLPQAEIANRDERRKNIQNAFAISDDFKNRADEFKNKIFILVDDVCTTTATLEECAKVLKILKPKEILGLVIARG